MGSVPHGCNSRSYCVCFLWKSCLKSSRQKLQIWKGKYRPERVKSSQNTNLASLWRESSRFNKIERKGENAPSIHHGPLSYSPCHLSCSQDQSKIREKLINSRVDVTVAKSELRVGEKRKERRGRREARRGEGGQTGGEDLGL